MKSYGRCLPGGPLNVRAIPFPIGEGVPHVAPLPERPVKADRPAPVTPPSVMAQRLVTAYATGEPAAEIARRLGVSRTMLYDTLKAAGVPTRKALS